MYAYVFLGDGGERQYVDTDSAYYPPQYISQDAGDGSISVLLSGRAPAGAYWKLVGEHYNGYNGYQLMYYDASRLFPNTPAHNVTTIRAQPYSEQWGTWDYIPTRAGLPVDSMQPYISAALGYDDGFGPMDLTYEQRNTFGGAGGVFYQDGQIFRKGPTGSYEVNRHRLNEGKYALQKAYYQYDPQYQAMRRISEWAPWDREESWKSTVAGLAFVAAVVITAGLLTPVAAPAATAGEIVAAGAVETGVVALAAESAPLVFVTEAAIDAGIASAGGIGAFLGGAETIGITLTAAEAVSYGITAATVAEIYSVAGSVSTVAESVTAFQGAQATGEIAGADAVTAFQGAQATGEIASVNSASSILSGGSLGETLVTGVKTVAGVAGAVSTVAGAANAIQNATGGNTPSNAVQLPTVTITGAKTPAPFPWWLILAAVATYYGT